jgi:hypothetical protein
VNFIYFEPKSFILEYFKVTNVTFFFKFCENTKISLNDMLVFLLHSRTAWEDYFTGSKTNYNSETYSSRQAPSGTGVYVSNCLFRSISSSSDGGALSGSSVTYLLVESSSFFSCKTSSRCGGAIYDSGGQCVLHKVCGYDCYSTGTSPFGMFIYNTVNDVVSSKNYVNYSSIVRCVGVNSDSCSTLCLGWGKICCP